MVNLDFGKFKKTQREHQSVYLGSNGATKTGTEDSETHLMNKKAHISPKASDKDI